MIPERQILYINQVMALLQEADNDLVERVKINPDMPREVVWALQDLWFTLWQDLCECSKKLKEVRNEDEK